MLTQVLHVNFSSLTVPHLISVVQGDTGRNLKCIVDDFTLDGAWSATWYVERPSDVPVYNTATIETSDNSVNLELTAQSINEVGDNKLQVRILDADDQVVTSFACILSVKPFGGIDAVESTTESNIFDQQVEEAFDEIDTHKADALEEIDTEIDTHVADGKFPNMAAGDIISDLYDENKVPYFFRQSGGGAEVGTIESPVLVGGSVGWNQLVPDTGSSLSVTVTSGHKYVMKKSGTLSVGSSDGSALTGLTGGTDMVTDLTLLLGSTIANRIYTLEQSTAGSGIAQLRAWGFDFDEYIPYTAPTLKHVEGVSAHVMRGFNQWDEEWEAGTISSATGENASSTTYFRSKNYIRLTDDTAYYLRCGTADVFGLRFYDANKNYISSTARNANTIIDRSYTIPQNACYMRFVDTSRNSYNHDICINISNSAKNGTYEPYRAWSYALDGDVTLRGIPKLDANNQLYYDGDTYEPDGTVTRRYAIRAYQNGDESLADAITDGTNTVYKLSTPTTETAEPYTQYQEVDASGTEEYVSTGVVPVGHVTKYPTDLKGTLETILSAIPSANGTYALKVTVANGKRTFSWV